MHKMPEALLEYLAVKKRAPFDLNLLGDSERYLIEETLLLSNQYLKDMRSTLPKMGNDLHFVFLEGYHFRQFYSFAELYNGAGLIGMYYPVPIIFRNLFYRALSNPTFWTSVGDPQKEAGFDSISDQIDDLEALFNRGRLFQPPSCPEREFIARALAATSTLFIFFHEFAHIRNGHLDWLAFRNGQPFHSETEGATGRLSGLERQALEWNADSIAALLTCNLVSVISRERWLTGSDEQKLLWVSHLLTAIYCTFRVMSLLDDTAKPLELRFHPPVVLRLLTTINVIVEQDVFKLDITKSVACAAVQGEEVFEAALGRPLTRDHVELGPSLGSNNDIFEYQAEIFRNWNRIHSSLSRFNRGNTPIRGPFPDLPMK
jgi:hypothetical protein